VDGVRHLVVGQTLDAAIDRMNLLGNSLVNFRGHDHKDSLRDFPLSRRPLGATLGKRGIDALDQAPSATDLTDEPDPADEIAAAQANVPAYGTPRGWYERAREHWTEVREAAAAATEIAESYYTQTPGMTMESVDYKTSALQNLIAGYLHYRNTLPLTAVREKFPRGGANEEAKRVIAVEHEQTLEPLDEARMNQTRQDLWALLDHQALYNLLTNDDGADAKIYLFREKATDDQHIVFTAIIDHIASMELSYPRACKRSRFRGSEPPFADLPEWGPFKKSITDGVWNVPGVFEFDQAKPWMGADSFLRPLVPEADFGVFDRFAVQIALNEKGTIRELYIGSRPESASGRHATAWVLLCDYVRGVVVGNDIGDVPGNIAREAEQLDHIHERIEDSSDIYRELGVPDPELFTIGDIGALHKNPSLDKIQAWVSTYLEILNETEGAIINTGGTSPGANEARKRQAVKTKGGLSNIAALFDAECARKLQGDITSGDSTGIKRDTYHIIALRLAIHLYAANKAYGEKYVPGLLSEEALAHLLSPTDISDDDAGPVNRLAWNGLNQTSVRGYDHDRYTAAAAKVRPQASAKDQKNPFRTKGDPDYKPFERKVKTKNRKKGKH
jgi:hypothetical protein